MDNSDTRYVVESICSWYTVLISMVKATKEE